MSDYESLCDDGFLARVGAHPSDFCSGKSHQNHSLRRSTLRVPSRTRKNRRGRKLATLKHTASCFLFDLRRSVVRKSPLSYLPGLAVGAHPCGRLFAERARLPQILPNRDRSQFDFNRWYASPAVTQRLSLRRSASDCGNLNPEIATPCCARFAMTGLRRTRRNPGLRRCAHQIKTSRSDSGPQGSSTFTGGVQAGSRCSATTLV
jgi:hypothetical protein